MPAGTPGTALVTGANGFIGSFLVERLLAEGYRVRCLVRRTSNVEFLPAGQAELAYGDVTDAASLAEAVRGCSHVFHLAGCLRGSRAEAYHRINVQGTEHLLAVATRHAPDVERVVIVSSIAAHGPSTPAGPATEDDPDSPVTYYGQSKLQAEQAARAYNDRLPITIVRPPIVYGPRERDFLQIFTIVKQGLRPRYRPDKHYSIVHARDLADGLALTARHPAADGRTYYLAEPRVYTWNEIVDTVAAAVNPRALAVPVGAWALHAAAALGEIYNRVSRREAMLSRQKLRELLPPRWTCSPARAEQELGFAARVPLAEGIPATAEWYRQQGWL